MPQLWARFPCRLGERHGGADIKGGHISQKQRLNAAPAQEALNFRPVRVMIKPPREGQNVRRAFEGRAADEAGVEAGQINISGPYPERVQAVPGCGPRYTLVGGDNAVRIHYAGTALGIALAHVYALKARDAGLGNAEVVYAEAPYDAGAQPRPGAQR